MAPSLDYTSGYYRTQAADQELRISIGLRFRQRGPPQGDGPLLPINRAAQFVFIEGAEDSLKIGRAEMQEKLRTLHVPTEVVTLKDAPHPFWMSHPWVDQAAQAMGDWFDKYLR